MPGKQSFDLQLIPQVIIIVLLVTAFIYGVTMDEPTPVYDILTVRDASGSVVLNTEVRRYGTGSHQMLWWETVDRHEHTMVLKPGYTVENIYR